VPRYPLIADVEIYEPVSRTRLDGRTAEISTNGCYVDLTSPLPKNTLIQVRISRDSGEFRTWARVAYVHDKAGMGLAFFDTTAEQRRIIGDWIGELQP